MPSYRNSELLEQRISQCYSQLSDLLQYQEISYLLKIKMRQINAFYLRAFDKASHEEEAIAIIRQYEEFIITASEVHSGQITAEQAYEKVKEKTEEGQMNVLIHNILTVCELLFWVAAAAISYTICISIGLPLLFLEPLIGFAVSAGAGILFLFSVDNASNCFEEFKTFDRTNHQYERERDVYTFFSAKALEKRVSEEELNSTTTLESMP